MKKIILLLIASLIASFHLMAQESLLNFKEENLLISGSLVNVGNTLLKGDIKEITKYSKSFIKTHIDANMKNDNGVLIVKETVVNQISNKRGDLMIYLYNKDNEISFNLAYKLGYDIYLNSEKYPDEFSKLKDFVNYFVDRYYTDYLPKYIKDKEKTLKVLQKEIIVADKLIKKTNKNTKKLTKGNNKNQKQITKNNTKIAEAQNEEEKIILNTKQEEINKNLETNTKTINYNKGFIETQESIKTNLAPKIDSLMIDINSSKLTLIEVRSRVKTSK